jgi:two-component sensor histidine kinase
MSMMNGSLEKALASGNHRSERTGGPSSREQQPRALVARIAELEAELERNEVLLQEVNHRVKNSLQLIASLLNLHRRSSTDPKVREQFDAATSRVMAISSLHERLYKTDRARTVEFSGYLQALCRDLSVWSDGDHTGGSIEVQADQVELPTEQAMPLALIANELVTNAIKHAYPGQPGGPVSVLLKRMDPPTVIQMIVSDQGVGAGAAQPTTRGMGTRLVHTLAQQIGARLDTADLDPGHKVVVTFASGR